MKTKKETFEDLVKSIEWHSLDTLNAFMFTYSKLKSFIYKMNPKKQIKLTLFITCLLFDSQIFVIKELINTFKENETKVKKLKFFK